MSVVRWSDESQVYLYPIDDKCGFECCGCLLKTEMPIRGLDTVKAHFDAHRAAGHKVPDYAYDNLRYRNPKTGKRD